MYSKFVVSSEFYLVQWFYITQNTKTGPNRSGRREKGQPFGPSGIENCTGQAKPSASQGACRCTWPVSVDKFASKAWNDLCNRVAELVFRCGTLFLYFRLFLFANNDCVPPNCACFVIGTRRLFTVHFNWTSCGLPIWLSPCLFGFWTMLNRSFVSK